MNFKNLHFLEKKFVIKYDYNLIREKAIKLKKNSLESFSTDDDYNLKDIKITEDTLTLIDLVTNQLINYKGISFIRPFENLSVSGFDYFFYLINYQKIRQIASFYDNFTIDKILLLDKKTKHEIWLANKVKRISDKELEKYTNLT